MSINVTITELPHALTITGTEAVPIVQNGVTVQTTTAALAGSPVQTQSFLTANNEPTLPNSRALTVGTGLSLADSGPQGTLQVNLTGGLPNLNTLGTGIVAKTSTSTFAARALATSGAGLSVTDGDGVANNPTFQLTGVAAAIASSTGTGMLALIGGTVIANRTITGTANQIAVTDGDGANNPTISLANNPVVPGAAGLTVPVGPTASRSVSAGVGTLRYNTDLLVFEGYTTTGWGAIVAGNAVTSFSAGSTGLTPSSATTGPIVLGGTLNVTSGGTGTSTPALVAGTNVNITGAWPNQTINATNSGTVSSVSVVAINGFAGTVANSTTTPAISLSTSVSGLLKGNGTAISAAISGTDYAPATSGTSILYGNGTGGFSNVAIGSGVSFAGGTLSATGSGGTVTSVAASVPAFLSVSGSPVTTTGTLAISYSGTALPIANGGTGQTTASAAITALTGTQTSGYYLRSNGTDAVLAAIVAGDVPTLNQNTTGTASNVTGTVAVANGGTGATVAATARANLSAAKSGANTDITSVTLTTGTITTAPTSSDDIVNKSYADSIASGVNFHAACNYATTAALSAAYTYNNGASGVGATITAVAVGTLTIDGYTFTSGDVGKRILIKNETGAYVSNVLPIAAFNGVYTLTTAGTAGVAYVLTRATDYDTSGTGTNEIDAGDLLLVLSGTANANTSWVQQTLLPITVGTTSIAFIQFAAVQTYTAGTGLSLISNQFSITNIGTAGTYGSATQVPVVVTNAQGQVTSVTNTAINIAASQITSGQLAIANGGTGTATPALVAGTNVTITGTWPNQTINSTGGGGGGGTVTSVELSAPALFTVTGSPVTTSGTLALTYSGTALPIANGGTGQTTASAAFNALSPITSTGDLILGNGTNSATRLAIGTNGQVLTSNGTTASWSAATGGGSAYTRTSFTATAGQTAFTVTYAVGYLQVYVNGVLLATSDYTATSGTGFTLGIACASGDIVEALVITTSVVGVTTGKSIAMAMIFGY